MSEFHVQVVRLGPFHPHPNADTLDITKVYDYTVIVKRGTFSEGQLAVYVPIDSVVPDNEHWHWLVPPHADGTERFPVGQVPERYRVIEAKKLRGTFSQGCLMPLPSPQLFTFKEGEDVARMFDITKYEPPVPMTTGGECEAAPTGWTFPSYTDIEGMRRYPNIIQDDEEVVVTEKIHGCLQSHASITMHDGSKKRIKSVIVGDVLLGVDDAGNTVASRVTHVWQNGKSTTWQKIRSSRKSVKTGNPFCQVICTPTHQIAIKVDNKIVWRDASAVRVGNTTIIHRSDVSLPELQRQIMIGMLLGDASVGGVENDFAAWSMCWGHSIKDIEYVEWIERALGDIFFKGSRDECISGYGSTILRGHTIWSHSIREAFKQFKRYDVTIPDVGKHGKKVIPLSLVEDLTPLALAFWYMDDGSLGHGDGSEQDNVAGLATCSFDDADHDILLAALSRLGITGQKTCYDYNRIAFNAVNAEKLFLLIAPFIPSCMQRKLPPRYRGGPGWLPPADAPQRYTQLVEQTVLSNENCNEKSSERFDLTTETQNFFANEMLVHNSSARYAHDGDRLWVGSHHQIKKRDEKSVWWQVANAGGFEVRVRQAPFHVFFGEVYGAVQDLKYGVKSGCRFRVFDVYDAKTQRYLDHDDAFMLADNCDMAWVPVLYRGPWKPELVGLSEGKSTIADHVREGIVVKPVKERWNEEVGRVVLKRHGEGYLLRKKK